MEVVVAVLRILGDILVLDMLLVPLDVHRSEHELDRYLRMLLEIFALRQVLLLDDEVVLQEDYAAMQ